MMKRRTNAGREAGLMFYRDSNGNEIDLLVPDGTGIEAYEIKSASTYSSSFETGFRHLPDQLSSRLTRRAILYNGNQERRDAPIEVLHYSSLLSV